MKTLLRGLKAVALVAALFTALVGFCAVILKAIEHQPVWTTVTLLLFVLVGLSWLVGSALESDDYLDSEDGE